MPRSTIENPNSERKGNGTKTVVGPSYATSNGRVARKEENIFTLQGKSRTSSAKPRNNIIHNVVRHAGPR